MRAALAGLVITATACASMPAPPQRSMLVSTDQIEGNFVLRQQLRFRVADRGGAFEAVVQKLCDELTVVGLTPLGIPAFSIRQRGIDMAVETHLPGRWPFPPENVLLDIHRVYFLPLRAPPRDGTYTQRIGDETVEERWAAGLLFERVLREDRVVIHYPEGARPGGPVPRDARLRNERLGYEIHALVVEERALDCEPP